MSNDAYVFTPAMAGTNYANNGLNQVTAIGGAAVGYDDKANIDDLAGDDYGYDAFNRMTSADVGAGAAVFGFDPAGRLATSAASSATTRYQYAGAQLVAEYDGSGALARRHVPGLGLDGVVASYDGSGTRSWLLADERGSVVGLAGSTGAVTSINRYDEYGVPASGNAGRFQYTGQQWLAEAESYHYRARSYLQGVGRFGQTDPIGYGAGANVYAYVGGDPVNLVDPLGLQVRGRGSGDGYQDCWWPGEGPMGSTPIICRDPVFPTTVSLGWGDINPSVDVDLTTTYIGPGGSASVPSPPPNIPGGPWTAAGLGQQPGTFFGPRQPRGPRAILRWVPHQRNGGPPGSRGYWKVQLPGQDWQRYNRQGQPITPEEAHPNRGLLRAFGSVLAAGGSLAWGAATFVVVTFWPTPAY